MSTSRELKTALFYSHSKHSLIFKFVTRSFMERGADVAWLSAFPGEKEVLFPPLTYLQPVSEPLEVEVDLGQGERITYTVITVIPHIGS